MIIVSQLIDLACRIGGPRFSHEVQLRRLRRWKTFEPEFYLLDRLVDPERCAVDIGANEGIYAGRLAQLCPRVHCFEPIPWFAGTLRRRLKRSVIVHELALSNKTGRAALRIPYRGDLELHGATTIEAANPLQGFTHVKTVDCALRRLDDCVDEPVGFIKIDVEGHELAVLEGAQRLTTTYRPVLLIESEFRHNTMAPESVFDFLGKQDYAGAFMKEGKLLAVTEFRRETDQSPHNLSADTAEERRRRPYVNNFIFAHPDTITRLLLH